MSYWFDDSRYRHEAVTVRTIWVTIALSLLVHLAALFLWIPRSRLFAPGEQEAGLASDRLQVRLAAIPTPAPVQMPEPRREIVAPKLAARPPRTTLRARPPPLLGAPTPAAP